MIKNHIYVLLCQGIGELLSFDMDEFSTLEKKGTPLT